MADAPVFSAGYNIAPSNNIPIIRQHPDRELANCHWGLISHWAKDITLKPINARVESITAKPWFRESFKQRRCLIPTNGYYEWNVVNGRKQPYFIRITDLDLFSFAGVRSYWQGPDNTIESCAIITTTANDDVSEIHDRMPVIIAPDSYAA